MLPRCDAVCDVGTFIEFHKNNDYCREGSKGLYHEKKNDVETGYQDLGVGVRSDLVGVPEALSVHIMELRTEGDVAKALSGAVAGRCDSQGEDDDDEAGTKTETEPIPLRGCVGVFALYGFAIAATLAIAAFREARSRVGDKRTLLDAIREEIQPMPHSRASWLGGAHSNAAAKTVSETARATRRNAVDVWTSSASRRRALDAEIGRHVRENRVQNARGFDITEADWVYWSAQLAVEDDSNEAEVDGSHFHDDQVKTYVLEHFVKPIFEHAYLTASHAQKAALRTHAKRAISDRHLALSEVREEQPQPPPSPAADRAADLSIVHLHDVRPDPYDEDTLDASCFCGASEARRPADTPAGYLGL